jgi:two-component system KDP operon response regulator KdpE
MCKPILSAELAARLRALVRREVPQVFRQRQSFFVDGDLLVDLTRQEVRRHDEPVALTSTEFHLLSCLVKCEGEVLSYERLMREVWGPEQAGRRAAVKQYIYHLRQKLEPDPAHPQRIVTRWGEGYMLRRLNNE